MRTRDNRVMTPRKKERANSFIAKPVMHEGLVRVMESLESYWFEIAELPEAGR